MKGERDENRDLEEVEGSKNNHAPTERQAQEAAEAARGEGGSDEGSSQKEGSVVFIEKTWKGTYQKDSWGR